MGLIDRSLNYGRENIERFTQSVPAERPVVLDLGAGQGFDLSLVRKVRPAAVLHAVEVDPQKNKYLQDQGFTVHPLNIETDRLPFKDGALDLVISNQVLEHAKELFWILHEVCRTLRVGGRFIVGVPNLASLHNRILLLVGRQPTSISLKNCAAHVRGFTKQDFIAFLERCYPGGLVLKSTGGGNFYPFPPLIARPLARLFPTMAWGIFLLLEKQREYSREFLDFPVAAQLETNFYLGPAAT